MVFDGDDEAGLWQWWYIGNGDDGCDGGRMVVMVMVVALAATL